MNLRTFSSIKYFVILLAIASLGWGCSNVQDETISSDGKCPQTPEVALKSGNVKAIDLSSEEAIASGKVSRREHKGYSFEAKAGDRFDFQTEQDICLWLYDPENELLEEMKFERDGQYIIQISVPQGSTTFELAMSLTNEKNVASTIAKSPKINPTSNIASTVTKAPKTSPTSSASFSTQNNPVSTPISPPQNNSSSPIRPDPKNTIQQYYSYINSQQYSLAWDILSSQIKNNSKLHPNGYNSYYNWWTTVAKIDVKDVRIVESYTNTATVDIWYNYNMNRGNITPQSLRFFLDWDDSRGQWQITRIKVNS